MAILAAEIMLFPITRAREGIYKGPRLVVPKYRPEVLVDQIPDAL